MARPHRRGRTPQRRSGVAASAPCSLSALHRLGVRRHEERLDPTSGFPGSRRRVPAGVRRRRPLVPCRHGRACLPRAQPRRLPAGAGRYRLRRPAHRRARQARRLNFELSDEQELIRRTVREFAESKVAPVAEELDREARFPYDLVGELGELGLMGLPVPEEYGGAGGDTLSYAIAIEELTRIDSSVAITVAAHTSLGTMPIFLFGSEEQNRAELRDGQWVVSGSKIFITNAGTDITACITITARTGDDEVSNVIVPNGTPGYAISQPMKKLGWRASDTRELSFRECAVPEGNLLGGRGRGFVQFLEILDGGRI